MGNFVRKIGESKSKIGESKSKMGLNYEHKRKEKLIAKFIQAYCAPCYITAACSNFLPHQSGAAMVVSITHICRIRLWFPESDSRSRLRISMVTLLKWITWVDVNGGSW